MESKAQPKSGAPPPPKRRWFQYSTRALLLFTLACGVVLGFWVSPAQRQQRAVQFLENLGGSVSFADEHETGLGHSPDWPRQTLGREYFATVVGLRLSKTQISDSGLVHLQGLTALERLSLYDTRISDAGLAQLKEMTALERLSLHSTQISDAGLTHLQGLAALEVLYLHNTQVSDAGMSRLQTALPNCRIEFAP